MLLKVPAELSTEAAEARADLIEDGFEKLPSTPPGFAQTAAIFEADGCCERCSEPLLTVEFWRRYLQAEGRDAIRGLAVCQGCGRAVEV